MADDNGTKDGNNPEVQESPDATPEGFARFKASTLKLTPLEVLMCLESLSHDDQTAVTQAHFIRSQRAVETATINHEIEALKAKLDAIKDADGYMLKRLETRHDNPYLTVGTQQANVGIALGGNGISVNTGYFRASEVVSKSLLKSGLYPDAYVHELKFRGAGAAKDGTPKKS